MHPIQFECQETIARSAREICTDIADLTRWPEFRGYMILPGIESATYEKHTEDMVGSRIRVRNTDGSGHVEEIREWRPGEAIVMTLAEFTPPLSRLADHFVESWHFATIDNATLVTRHFQLFPKNATMRPLLWLISLFFKRAIAQHLAEMRQEVARDKSL
jgi:hypothetical protein